jgi:hypothetical protein
MNDQSLIFDWDDANLAHIAQHDVSQQEAEQVILGDPLDMNCKFQTMAKSDSSNLGRRQEDGFCNWLQLGVAGN